MPYEPVSTLSSLTWPPAFSRQYRAPTAPVARTSPPAPKDRRRRGSSRKRGESGGGSRSRRLQLVADLEGQVAGDLQVGPGRAERLAGRGEHRMVGVPVGRREAEDGAGDAAGRGHTGGD